MVPIVPIACAMLDAKKIGPVYVGFNLPIYESSPKCLVSSLPRLWATANGYERFVSPTKASPVVVEPMYVPVFDGARASHHRLVLFTYSFSRFFLAGCLRVGSLGSRHRQMGWMIKLESRWVG